MKKKYIITIILILLGFTIYFDFLSENKPEYWTLFRSLSALVISFIVLFYVSNKK